MPVHVQDALYQELKEANFVTGLVDLGAGLLGYTLANCTIGAFPVVTNQNSSIYFQGV